MVPLVIIGIVVILSVGGVYSQDSDVGDSAIHIKHEKVTDSSADDNTDLSHFITSPGIKKAVHSPMVYLKESIPTYTWVYAIIGIVALSYLFYSSYWNRDE